MEELEVTSEHTLAISRIHEKVISCVCGGDGISDFFNNIIGVKQSYPLSPTLFGVCIDELEQIVVKFVNDESIEEVVIENVVIILLLYTNDIVLFGDAQGHLKSFACILS